MSGVHELRLHVFQLRVLRRGVVWVSEDLGCSECHEEEAAAELLVRGQDVAVDVYVHARVGSDVLQYGVGFREAEEVCVRDGDRERLV